MSAQRISPEQLALYVVSDQSRSVQGSSLQEHSAQGLSGQHGRSVVDSVVQAVRGGATCVQVRLKDVPLDEYVQCLREISEQLPAQVPLIVNDRVDVFLAAREREIAVSGVHIGGTDGDPRLVRAAIGDDAILGLSVRSQTEITRWTASGAQVDYFGIGPVFDTATKVDAPAGMGVEQLTALVAHASIPCVAIGGITVERAAQVMASGVAGVAVVSALCGAPDPAASAREFMRAIRQGTAKNATGKYVASNSATRNSAPSRLPVVLTIAGTDPTAGAGVQGDCKTIAALNGYAVSVVTAVVAQNTLGVDRFDDVSPDLIRRQLDAVWADTHVDAIKIGMLASTHTINAVAQWLATLSPENRPPIVIDPVMVATSGDALFDPAALDALKKLISQCAVVTPNAEELATLTGHPVPTTAKRLLELAYDLAQQLGVHVVAKGGHLTGNVVHDALITHDPVPRTAVHVEHTRVSTHRTHGTGCALSSAIATKLAHQPHNLTKAFIEARTWLQHAIENADTLAFGRGNGPIHHLAPPQNDATTAPLRHLNNGRDPRTTLPGWWEASARIRTQTDQLPFVQELAHGTLSTTHFLHYLEQDALYLREYSRALAVAADLAPTLVEQRFWMQGAHASLVVERALHDSWLATAGLDLESPAPTPITRAYTQHFLALAREKNYEQLIAALLPCYWMYQDIGDRLNRNYNHPDHPYREWLTAYSDPQFETSTLAARTIVAHHVEAALAQGNERLVGHMYAAFLTSCQHERDFFAGPATYGERVTLASLASKSEFVTEERV